MGNALIKFSRVTFEVVNETFTGVAGGALGILVIVSNDFTRTKILPTLLLTTITFGSLYYVYNTYDTIDVINNKVIVITGCDTGLGYSLALYSNIIGFRVIAGCLDLNSKGAEYLKSKNIQCFHLDITNEDCVKKFVGYVKKFMDYNPCFG